MSAVNRYFLDGIDMYTAYGYIVTSGSDSFLQLPKRKEPLSHDWKDENGIEYDLLSPATFEARTISLKGYIVALNETDFWAKYNAFKAKLQQTGAMPLKCQELNMTVSVIYKECSQVNRRTRVRNSALIGMEFDLLFQEVVA